MLCYPADGKKKTLFVVTMWRHFVHTGSRGVLEVQARGKHGPNVAPERPLHSELDGRVPASGTARRNVSINRRAR